MPCATPPWIWPSASSGLITLPQSSTQTYRRMRVRPSSVSTSTTQTCVPKGKVKFSGCQKAVSSSPGSSPGGKLMWEPRLAAAAICVNLIARWGAPLTRNSPSTNSRSSGLHSSWWAAIRAAFFLTFCRA